MKKGIDDEGLLPGSGELRRWRLVRWTVMALCVLGLAWTGAPTLAPVAAQPVAAPDEEELDETDPGATEGTSDSDDTDKKKDSRKRRTVLDTLVHGGWVGLLIVLLSMVAVGFIVEHFMTIRKTVLMPDAVVDDLERMIAQGQVDDAIEYCHELHNYSLASSVILAGLERYKGSEFGFAEYKSAVEEEGEAQTARLYRKTEVLGLIGAIAPMLGLTGTVLGMLLMFITFGTETDANEMGEKIGIALVTTLLGLGVAIPALSSYAILRNRVDALSSEAMVASQDLIAGFHPGK